MAEINLQPLAGSNNRVVVEPASPETQTASGIIIPDTAQEKPQRGEVIAVSEDGENKPTVKKGDTVVYGKYSGTEFEFDGKEFLIMRESDIFAIIK